MTFRRNSLNFSLRGAYYTVFPYLLITTVHSCLLTASSRLRLIYKFSSPCGSRRSRLYLTWDQFKFNQRRTWEREGPLWIMWLPGRKTCPGSDGPLQGGNISPSTESFARSLFRFAGISFEWCENPPLARFGQRVLLGWKIKWHYDSG